MRLKELKEWTITNGFCGLMLKCGGATAGGGFGALVINLYAPRPEHPQNITIAFSMFLLGSFLLFWWVKWFVVEPTD